MKPPHTHFASAPPASAQDDLRTVAWIDPAYLAQTPYGKVYAPVTVYEIREWVALTPRKDAADRIAAQAARIAELRAELHDYKENSAHFLARAERAESALAAAQHEIVRLGKALDKVLLHCTHDERMQCAEACCPFGEPLHFHHDGCPACCAYETDAAAIDAARSALTAAGEEVEENEMDLLHKAGLNMGQP